MKILGYIIVVKRSGTDGTPYPLTSANPSCNIGRGIECDIRVQLPVVSLQHCRIEVEASGKAYLTNVSSSNPAYLNDVRLCPEEVKLLSHTDVIHIADRKLRWEYPEESALYLTAKKEDLTFKILTPKSKAPVNNQQEVPSKGDGNAEKQIVDTTRNKKVSFGRELIPEHFDKQLPPSTPVRKGEKPDGCAFATPYASSSVKRTTRLSILPSTPSIAEEPGAETPTKSLLRRRSPTPIKPYLARSLGLLTPKSLSKNGSTLEQNTSKDEVNGDAGSPHSEYSPSSSPNNGAFKSSPQSSVQSPKGTISPTLSSSNSHETPKASLTRSFSNKTPETSCLKSPKPVSAKRSPGTKTVTRQNVNDSLASPETPSPNQSLMTLSPKISSKSSSPKVVLETVSYKNLSKTPEPLSASKSCSRKSLDQTLPETPDQTLPETPDQKSSTVSPDQRSLKANENRKSVLDTKQDPESVTSSPILAVNESSPQTQDSVTPQNSKWQLKREAKSEVLGASPALKRRKTESDIIKDELKNSQKSRRSVSVDAISSQRNSLAKDPELLLTEKLPVNISKDIHSFSTSDEAKVIPSPKKGKCNELTKPLEVGRSSSRKLGSALERRSLRTPKNTKPEVLGYSKINTPVVLFDTKTKHETPIPCTLKNEIYEVDVLPDELHSMPEVDVPDVSKVDVLEMQTTQEEDLSKTPVLSKTKSPRGRPRKNVASQIEDVKVDKTPEISKTKTMNVKTPKDEILKNSETDFRKTPRAKISEVDLSQTFQVAMTEAPNVGTPTAVKTDIPDISTNLTPKYKTRSLDAGTPKTEPNHVKTADSPKKNDEELPKTPKTRTPKMNTPKVDTPLTKGKDIPGENAKADEDTPKKLDRSLHKTPKAKTPHFNTPKIPEVDISSSSNDSPVKERKTRKSGTPEISRVKIHEDEASLIPTDPSLEISENIEPKDDSCEVVEKEELRSLDVEDDLTSEHSTDINRSYNSKSPSKRKSLGKLGDRVGVCRMSIRMMDLGKRETPMRKILKPASVKKNQPRYKSPSVSSNVEQSSKRKASLSPASPKRKKIKTGAKTPNAGSKPVLKTSLAKTPKTIGKTPKKSWADVVKKGLMAHGIPAAKAQRVSNVMNKARILRRTRKQEVIENCVPSFNPEVPKNFNFTQSTGHVNSPAPIIIRKKIAKTPKIYRKGQKSLQQGTTQESIENIDLDGLADLLNTPKSKDKDMIKQITGWSLPDIVNHYTPLSKAVRMKELFAKNSRSTPLSKVPSQETKTPETSFSSVSLSTVTPPGKDVLHDTSVFSPVTPPNPNVSRRRRSSSSVTNTPVSHANTTNFDFCAVKTPDITGDNLISPLVTPNVSVKNSDDLFSSNESSLESPEPIETDCTTFDFDNAVTPAVTPDVFVSPMSTRSKLTTPRVARTPKASQSIDSVKKNTAHPPELQDVKEISPSDEDRLHTPKAISSNVVNTKRLLRMSGRSSAGEVVECTNVNSVAEPLQISQKEEESKTADNSDDTDMKLEGQETPTEALELHDTNKRRMRLSRTPKEQELGNKYSSEKRKLRTSNQVLENHGTDYCNVSGISEYDPDHTDEGMNRQLKTSKSVTESPETDHSNLSCAEKLIKTPKADIPRTPAGELKTPKAEPNNTNDGGIDTPHSPIIEKELDNRNISGIKKLRTPKASVKSSENDYSNVDDVDKMTKTPKVTSDPESPQADYTQVAGVKKLLKTPKVVPESPQADYTQVAGVKKLLRTPKVVPESPQADYTQVAGVKKLLKTPKVVPESPQADYTQVAGVKKLLRTPKVVPESPQADYTQVAGMKKLLSTPKPVPESPQADYTLVAGVKKLLKTPKAVPESPQADYTQVAGVKKLLSTPKTLPESPKADYTQVAGMKKLLSTPKTLPESPKADYTQVAGMKKLLSTPKTLPESPKADYTQVAGMKKLLSTPKTLPESPKADYTQVAGVKKLLSTPKAVVLEHEADYTDVSGLEKLLKTPSIAEKESHPVCDYTNVHGLKKLLKTPRRTKNVEPDYSDPEGLDKLMKTPRRIGSEPLSDYTNVEGLKNLLKTPAGTIKSPQADYTQVYGVRSLLKTPRATRKSIDADLSGLSHLMKTPLTDNSNVGQLLDMVKESVSSTKQSVRTPSVVSTPTGSLSENIPPKDDLKTVVGLVRDESVKEVVSPRRSHRNNKSQDKDIDSKILDLVQETSPVHSCITEESKTEKNIVKDNIKSVDLAMDVNIQDVASPCTSKTNVKIENDDTPRKRSRRVRSAPKVADNLDENHKPDDAVPSKPNKRGRKNTTHDEMKEDQEVNIGESKVGKELRENINSNNVSMTQNYDGLEETDEKKSTSLKRSKRQQVCKSNEEVLGSPSVDSLKVREELSSPKRRGRRRLEKDIQSEKETSSTGSDIDSSEVTKEKVPIQKRGRGRQVKGILVLEESSPSSLDIDNVLESENVRTPQRRGRGQKVTFEGLNTPQDSPVKGRRKRNVTDITSAPSEISVPAKRGRGNKKIGKEEETLVQERENSITVLEVETVNSDEGSVPAKSHKGTRRTRTRVQTKGDIENTEKDSEETHSTKNSRPRPTLSKSSTVESENDNGLEKPGNKENEFITEESKEAPEDTFTPFSESSPTDSEIHKSCSANDEKSATKTIVKKVQNQSTDKELKVEENSSPVVRRGRRKNAVERCDSSTEDISEILDEKSDGNKKAVRAPRRTRGQTDKTKIEECLPQESKDNLQKITVDKHGSSTENTSKSVDNKTEDDTKAEKVPHRTRGRSAKTKAEDALSQHYKEEEAVGKSDSSKEDKPETKGRASRRAKDQPAKTKAEDALSQHFKEEEAVGKSDSSKEDKPETKGRASRRTKDQPAKTKAEPQLQHLEDVLEKTGLGEKEGKPASKGSILEKETKRSGRQPRVKKTLDDDIDAKIEEAPVSKARRGSKRKDIMEQEEETEAQPTRRGNKKVVLEKEVPATRRGNKAVATEEIQTPTKRGSRKKPAEEDIASPPKRVSRRTRAQK
ncbi:proliferation marker protein Ki-67-like [Palaemon carinicauda]|uniref:proliferation marker protein Ki-67-like n=1 Tax=Palaemon carinicauda TaxID=392227 RepID=UPI0035B6A3F1